jgi:three-Cys-motif partner protein
MAKHDEDFWQAAEDWSRRKHLILDYYLTPAAAKLRRASPDRRVMVLDGFAGRGEYEDGTPGSPVLIGQLADRASSWSDPVDLRVFNIEPDVTTFRELERCTASWTAKGVIRNLAGTFQDQLPVVLAEARQSPLFVLLDPFRPTHLHFDHFVPLLRRGSTTELCFVFHTPGVIRMLEALRPYARTAEANRHALRIRLSEVFGSDRWEGLLSGGSLDAAAVVACFKDELLRVGARNHTTYVGSHAIWERYQVGLKYHLVFLTRNPHGVRLMNDAFRKEARGVYAKTARSGQMRLFPDADAPPVEMDPAARVDLLHDTLVAVGREAPERRWKRADLILEVLVRRFGDFSESEHLDALKLLFGRAAGPRFRPVDGRATRSGGWVTNHNTTLAFHE